MAAVEPPVPSPDAAKVVIQEEPRYEVLGEPGPYMVMEVDENGAVLSTAYYGTHADALEFANVIADEKDVQDDSSEETVAETDPEPVEEPVVETPNAPAPDEGEGV